MNAYTEQQVSAFLVKTALSSGYAISVNDGEETTVKKSKNAAQVLSALETTGEDYLGIYDANGAALGSIFLLWGNEPDELIADYNSSEAIEALYEKTSQHFNF